MKAATRRVPAAGLAAGLAVVLGCHIDTQRHPGPMHAAADPLPPGVLEDHPQGPEEVLVVRHADPSLYRPAGSPSTIPLPFYRRSARASSGSWVFAGAGGRLEVLWSDGTSIVLFDRGAGIVGSPSRGEPTFMFRELTRTTLSLGEGDRVQLPGGAVLLADTGPFVIERERQEILRVYNRSKGTGRVAYRTELFDLDPGHVIDLPLLEVGSEPIQIDPAFQTMAAAGTEILVRGAVELRPAPAPGRTRLEAVGEHEIRAFGVRLRLEPGQSVTLGPVGTDLSAAPEPEPETEPEPEPAEAEPGPEPEPAAAGEAEEGSL